jgi:hypothetical protein
VKRLLAAAIQFALRLAIAVAVALALAFLVSLLSDGAFRDDLAIGCAVVGCFSLLMAPAGTSPTMRTGTLDTWTASFCPKLVPGMGDYGKAPLSAPAVFLLTGLALLGLAAFLAS